MVATMAPPMVRMLVFMPAAAPVWELGTARTTCADRALRAMQKPSPPMAPARPVRSMPTVSGGISVPDLVIDALKP
jgi:hypothetical protein